MSSPKCWQTLMELTKADPRLAEDYEFRCFEYSTSIAQLRLLRRLPSVTEIGRKLGAFLAMHDSPHCQEITLIGHSQGGLVIQSYLADRLRAGKASELCKIRQVILIATPNLGSTKVSFVRKIFYTFFSNPQELALRVFNENIADVVNDIDGRIESAIPNDPHCWPIAIQCFWGEQDDAVLPASARGPFNNAVPLEGDHSSILRPKDSQDPRYRQIVQSILEPAGHPNVWEIDCWEVRLKVEPLQGAAEKYVAKYGSNKTREVVSDNFARMMRKVTFAKTNRCIRHFQLKYGTRNDGYLTAYMSDPNEGSDSEQQLYQDYGVKAVFEFTPQPGRTFTLDLQVWKGFDKGQRDVHFHLGRHEGYYKTARVALELSAYLAQGYTLSKAPALYYYEEDRGHSDLCQRRGRENPVPGVKTGDGLWEWEVHRIWGGVVEIVYDLNDPVVQAVTAAAPA